MSSKTVTRCQICEHPELESVLFLGFLPLCNDMKQAFVNPTEQPAYPTELLRCPKCELVQLGVEVDKSLVFPTSYPYTSSTTKVLRDNFTELYREVQAMIGLDAKDLVVDVGSNDGNLLSNFMKHKVLGITPEDIGKVAIQRGIPTLLRYFEPGIAADVVRDFGHARVVTATNVFAHIDGIHGIVEEIKQLLTDDGVFISESHYLGSLMETVQYDTVYHEHLRYYSLHSLKNLLESHGLEVFHARHIPTHGGSIRVYAGRKGQRTPFGSVANILEREAAEVIPPAKLNAFAKRVAASKLALMSIVHGIKSGHQRIHGISAPSRSSTLVGYCGIDHTMVDVVYETKGSHKIGKYVPGTVIPVEDEARLYHEQPEFALIFSWHIADEIMANLRSRGFKGRFIIPLPEPRVVD